ncbi:uncharacterized protein LOC120327686 [Styela clava]
MESSQSTGYRDVCPMFFLNYQNLDPKRNMTPEDLIFQNIKLDKEEKISISEMIKQQPGKCLFVLDVPEILDYESRNCGKRILLQLIHEKLFPHDRVITSERYFNSNDSEPQKIIAFCDLTHDSIEMIAIGYLGGTHGIEIMQIPQLKSTSLSSLCNIPVFLTYSIIGIKTDDYFKPSSISDVMIGSKNILNMEDLLGKLNMLVYTGIHKNKAIFNSQDLQRHHLALKETGDFTSLKVRMPKETTGDLPVEQLMSNFLNGVETPHDIIEKWREQNVLLHWNEIQIAHTNVTKSTIEFVSKVISISSSILEFALRDVNLTTDTILSYFKNSFCHIHEFSVNCEENISTLLPTICNILSNCKSKILNVSENDISEEFLRKLSQTLDDTNLVKTLIGLDLSHNTSIQDFSSLADIMKKLPIEVLRLMNCGIIEENLKSLTINIFEGKVKHLNLSYNPEMTSSCFKIIVSLLHTNDVDFLGLSECELTNEKINALRESLQSGTSIRAFDISYNECLEFENKSDLILLIKNHNVKDLNVSGCELTEDQVESMGKALQGHKFETLNISDNVSIRDGVKHVGEMVGTCPIVNLDMSECMFNTRQLNSFVDELGSSQLKTLNISDSERYVDTEYIKVVCKLVPKVKKELTVCFSRMSEGCLDLLQTTLDHTGNKNLRVTYGYKTDSIKPINNIKFTPSIDMRKYLVYKTNVLS